MGDEDIKIATDYLISSLQDKEMMSLTFPLLVLFSNIMLRYVDQQITREKHQQVLEVYVKLLHSMSDARAYTDSTLREHVETLWVAAYFTGSMKLGQRGSRTYKKYSESLIKFCSQKECEEAMTRFLDKGIYLKKDEPEYDNCSLFNEYANIHYSQKQKFTRDLYNTFIAASVAVVAYETLTHGTEGVNKLHNSIAHHMEGLKEELSSWYKNASIELSTSLLSSTLNKLPIEELCDYIDDTTFSYYSRTEETHCLCYEMYFQSVDQSLEAWNEFRFNFLNYSNNKGADALVCFYFEEWYMEEYKFDSDDSLSVHKWLNSVLDQELVYLVADNGLPKADASHCDESELKELKYYNVHVPLSTLSTLHPACIADIIELLFDRKFPEGSLFGLLVYKSTTKPLWRCMRTKKNGWCNDDETSSRRLCREFAYDHEPYLRICVFVKGLRIDITETPAKKLLPSFRLLQATSLIQRFVPPEGVPPDGVPPEGVPPEVVPPEVVPSGVVPPEVVPPEVVPDKSRACGDQKYNFGLVFLFHLLACFC